MDVSSNGESNTSHLLHIHHHHCSLLTVDKRNL